MRKDDNGLGEIRQVEREYCASEANLTRLFAEADCILFSICHLLFSICHFNENK
jgi:hypothetical protein